MVIERRVGFSQTDAAGLIHFTTYFTFMEAAEAELFRRLGLPLIWEEDDRTFGFPRVECNCKFRRPVGFDAMVQIELKIDEIVANRISYTFTFRGERGKACATGTMVTAFACRQHSGKLESSSIPETTMTALLAWKNQAE
jgi:YbgC/YbaW family acyl-CoA thioester hydrolase